MHSRRTLQSTPAAATSFNAYSAIRLGQIAARVIRELALEDEENEAIQTVESAPPNLIDRISGIENPDQEPGPQLRDPKITAADGSDSDDFEFTFFPHDPAAEPIPADELFSDGQFRPMFPVFNRDLLSANGSEVRLPVRKILNQDRDPATSSSDATADAVPEQLPTGSFCVWASRSVPPSPSRCKKSNSTGSTKLWKFRDLLHRSSSDGKETFLFLSPAATAPASATRAPASTKEVKTENAKGKKVNSGDATKGKVRSVASAHELLYVRNRAMKEEDRRRSFLPYRQDIVGFFGNVNGLSRTFLPF